MRAIRMLVGIVGCGAFMLASGIPVQAATLTFERDFREVEPGASFAGRVTLPAAAATDVCVAFSTTQPTLVSMPASLTIPAGGTFADFRVTVARTAVPAVTGISIRASVAPCLRPTVVQRDLYLLPPAKVAAVAVAPSAVQGGNPATLSVKLDRPAAWPGVTVSLANSGSGPVAHPKSITVPSGRQDASVAVTTQPVQVPFVVGLTAATPGTSAATQLTLHGDPGSGEPAALAGITIAHNDVRASVGVPPLRWNASLAATAKQWASACVDDSPPAGLIDHNAGRSSGYPYAIGENVFASGGSAAGAAEAIAAWSAEAAQYNYAANTCSGVCGHYTQIVWRNTLEVGCGTALCPNLQYRAVLVCNYAPAGNVGGQRPY